MYEYTQTVKVVLEEEVSRADMKKHIREAVQSWGGMLHWTDPLFNIVKTITPGKCKIKET